MTRPLREDLRRDAKVKGASVITGLRLEPETARELVERACAQALEEPKPGRKQRGNVSEMARFFLRQARGLSAAEANQREERGHFKACLAGLAMEPELCAWLDDRAQRLGLPKAGAARHFIRLGLGFSVENSMAREAHFAELAAARHQASLGMATQFKGTR